MKPIVPYLIFNGRCEEAIRFYASCLGARIDNIMRMSDMPPHPDHPVRPEHAHRIMHAHLSAGDLVIMASDGMPDDPDLPTAAVQLSLSLSSKQEVDAIYGKLSEGGTVKMKPQPMFWGDYWGSLEDKFGMAWMVSCESK